MDHNNLNLIDNLILVAIHDNKGNFVSDTMVFKFGLAGAVLFELCNKQRIKIIANKVKVMDKSSLSNEVLDAILILLSETNKEKTVKYWLEKIAKQEKTIRENSLSKLIDLGILERQENKILWVFTQKTYPTKNQKPEYYLKKRLNDIIRYNQKAETNDVMLISLIDACKLNKEVYGKDVAKNKKKDIKDLIKNHPFANDTSKVIKEIHDAIIAALVIIMATTTVITAN